MTILFLAPHVDDETISAGGTIAKMVEGGYEVYVASFSFAKKSLTPNFPEDATQKEFLLATESLGVPEIQLFQFEYSTRLFPAYRQKILDEMLMIKKEIKPEMVFLPSQRDIHQDHKTIHQEGKRAFNKTTLLGYENPRNDMGHFHASTYVVLSKDHMKKKLEAMKMYKSQMVKYNEMPRMALILARLRGEQIGVHYAEAFETVRFILQ